jgi:hypothetical protein
MLYSIPVVQYIILLEGRTFLLSRELAAVQHFVGA